MRKGPLNITECYVVSIFMTVCAVQAKNQQLKFGVAYYNLFYVMTRKQTPMTIIRLYRPSLDSSSKAISLTFATTNPRSSGKV